MKHPRKRAAAKPHDARPLYTHQDPASGIWYWRTPRKARGDSNFKTVSLGRDKPLAWAEARRINQKLADWLATGARPDRRRRRAVAFTVAEVLADWRAKAWDNKRPKTREGYANMIRHLQNHLGDRAASTLSEKDVDDWIKDAGRTAPETVRHAVAVARTAFQWAARNELIPTGHNPFRRTGVGAGNKRSRWIAAADLRHVLAACEAAGRPSLGIAFCLAFLFVQRVSDALAFTRGHFVTAGNGVRLHFHQSKGMKLDAYGNIKRKGFLVDIAAPPAALDLVARLGNSGTLADPMILCEATSRPWEARAAANAFRRILAAHAAAHPETARALTGLQLRDARRSGFLHAVRHGSKVPDVCSMSGHSLDEGYAILEHYLPKTPDMADEAANAFVGIAL